MKFGKGAGLVGGIASIGITGYGMLKYYANGGSRASVGIKAVLDATMTGVGFLGPIGFGISSLYFILDAATDHFGGYGNTDEK